MLELIQLFGFYVGFPKLTVIQHLYSECIILLSFLPLPYDILQVIDLDYLIGNFLWLKLELIHNMNMYE